MCLPAPKTLVTKVVEALGGYVLLFSVLNHCTVWQRLDFLGRIHPFVSAGSKIYVTHARWTYPLLAVDPRFKIRAIWDAGGISGDLDLTEWGFPHAKMLFPILEITPVR